MIKIFSLFFICRYVLFAEIYPYNIKPNNFSTSNNLKIKILDTKELRFKNFNGIKVKELSALAYKDNMLYALGDKGILFTFSILLKENKIKSLSLLQAQKLKTKKEKRLKKKDRDSEGMTFIKNDLLISFERKPRVEVYTKSAVKVQGKSIHSDLKDIKNYRGKNKALESVAYNKEYGVLTAPEQSLKDLDEKKHIIYAKKQTWTFPSAGSIKALEFISKNKILILQRKFSFFTRRQIITLSSLNLKNTQYEVLASLDSFDGWNLDNFEGLTKIDEKRYLMISDNNGSFLQKTLLVLFKLE